MFFSSGLNWAEHGDLTMVVIVNRACLEEGFPHSEPGKSVQLAQNSTYFLGKSLQW